MDKEPLMTNHGVFSATSVRTLKEIESRSEIASKDSTLSCSKEDLHTTVDPALTVTDLV